MTNGLDRIDTYKDELIAIRKDFHKHPELAFEEVRTSGIVAEKLNSWGIETHTGIAKTGLVGVIKAGESDRKVGLRADMDALPIEEANSFEHKSVNEGVMHACGHDGHTTMLLGAAKYLAETKNFDGTVYLIFQPAEENYGGGKVMVEEGLFEKYPADTIFGMHNWPGMDVGKFGMRVGTAMAAFDSFEITVTGVGAHAAKPDAGIDPIVVGSNVVMALQSIVARNVSPLESAVVSVTQFHTGTAWNIIPETAVIRGCVRSLNQAIQAQVESTMHRVVENVCSAYGAKGVLDYRHGYPVTVNTAQEVAVSQAVTSELVGEKNVDPDMIPTMGSEDFGFMLQEKPGAYIMMGNGDTAGVHNPNYEFNDEALTLGSKYWSLLAETQLKV